MRRVLLVGGSIQHRADLEKYSKEMGFIIVTHVPARTKKFYASYAEKFDVVACMTVYASHYLTNEASRVAKALHIPLVHLSYGPYINALRVTGRPLSSKIEDVMAPAPVGVTELPQAGVLSLLKMPYQHALRVLAHPLAKFTFSPTDRHRKMYDLDSVRKAVMELEKDAVALAATPLPYSDARLKDPEHKTVEDIAAPLTKYTQPVPPYTIVRRVQPSEISPPAEKATAPATPAVAQDTPITPKEVASKPSRFPTSFPLLLVLRTDTDDGVKMTSHQVDTSLLPVYILEEEDCRESLIAYMQLQGLLPATASYVDVTVCASLMSTTMARRWM